MRKGELFSSAHVQCSILFTIISLNIASISINIALSNSISGSVLPDKVMSYER